MNKCKEFNKLSSVWLLVVSGMRTISVFAEVIQHLQNWVNSAPVISSVRGGVNMDKCKNNPFRPRSMRWALMEEDWSDLTIAQIAEVFNSTPVSVYASIREIKRITGYRVPHRRSLNDDIGI